MTLLQERLESEAVDAEIIKIEVGSRVMLEAPTALQEG